MKQLTDYPAADDRGDEIFAYSVDGRFRIKHWTGGTVALQDSVNGYWSVGYFFGSAEAAAEVIEAVR